MSNPAVHNPDNLESPGDPPWRFLVEGEAIHEGDEYWSRYDKIWSGQVSVGLTTDHLFHNTYRTQRPLPAVQPPASPSVCRHGFPLDGACPECDSVQATAGDDLENAPEPDATPICDEALAKYLYGGTIDEEFAETARQLERRAIAAETRCADLERALKRIRTLAEIQEIPIRLSGGQILEDFITSALQPKDPQ